MFRSLVSTESGLRAIESIHKGDLVWSRDVSNGETKLKRVVQTFEKYAATLKLTFSNGESIETTREHPFYVEGQGFRAAGELGIGTSIVTRAGPAVRLVSFASGEVQPVFNFEVEDFHTYFVGSSAVWVHNVCGSLDWSIVKASTGETRAAHVRLHNVDDVTKDVHGVFSEDGVNLVDEAWQKAVANNQDDVGGELVVEMGRVVGHSGGRFVANGTAPNQAFTKVRIILKSGTNQIITAMPY